jgi:glycosyltransferase involved in cell wall biosynthesis
MNFLISVVVITFNEEKNIEKCIASITSQTYKNIEIIISDGNSTDGTKDLVKKFSNAQFLICPEKGMPKQRNFGFKKAKGDYILSLDADMRIDNDLIAKCANAVSNNDKIVGLYIPEIILGNALFHRIRRFERSFYNETVIDAIRFFHKKTAGKINFFDENIREACEDWDFDKRMKKMGTTQLVDSRIYHDESSLTLKKYLYKKAKYMSTFSDYINKWGANDKDVKKQFGFYYRFFGVFIEKGKWKKILAHPVLACGMYFLRALVGVVYLFERTCRIPAAK